MVVEGRKELSRLGSLLSSCHHLSAQHTTRQTTPYTRQTPSTPAMLPLELRLLSRSLLAHPLRRSISSSPRSLRPAHSLESPTYPGLFYHSLPSPNSYSLSFLDTPPPSLSFSPTTIGILRPPPEDKGAGPPELVPRNFEENADFRELLHEVLRGAVAGDEWLQTMAKVRREGFMYALRSSIA